MCNFSDKEKTSWYVFVSFLQIISFPTDLSQIYYVQHQLLVPILLVFCQIDPNHLKKINEYIDNIDKQNTAKNEREMLAEIFEEDGIDSVDGP